ncbi:DNA sulfur modification protein DndD [Rhodococcus sp. Z13]|uniref:DNA sulfur modification protein DndD n=1 Tax=Rhodococcus sacchari TaxID=2962047 RepID=A0ACD4DJK6_9NOCA|nr:DNA sulfur modification protein DndD [Rhodococcus sp. Z13]UYP20197.1 DNA sulfur modification protein DndD [Rhodococcus sp. Z13]
MILDELVLQNVGTFSGRHTITLTPKSKTKPVVLVGGLNGAGKTTVLEAIHLALYGALAQPNGRRAGGYENYLIGLTHRGAPEKSISAVELEFRAFQQGKEHVYRISRRWGGAKAPGRESLDVEVDGRLDRALTSTWSEHVETFLPRGIAGLFFFDGEQIEALADLEKSREVLASALSSLLGLDLVDRLATDLSVLRRRHRANQVPESLKSEVEAKRELVTRARQLEEGVVQALAEARVELERADKARSEARSSYQARGGEIAETRTETEKAAEKLRQALDQVDDDLRAEAADVAPLLLVTDLLQEVESRAADESTSWNRRAVAGVLATRDDSILNALRESGAGDNLVTAISDFLERDRAERSRDDDVEDVTGLGRPDSIRVLRETALPSSRRRLAELVERRHRVREELDQIERVLVAMPDPESLEEVRRQLDEASDRYIRAQSRVMTLDEDLAARRTERSKADADYERSIEKYAQANMALEDDTRIVEHVDKVRNTLEALQVAAKKRYLGRIGEYVLEALHRLLRKSNLVTAIQIDPETYTVELTGPGGKQLSANQLSAGERQLLAVSLLWGLARASGQPLPVVVDTPLGRLDGEHREHLIERYFPFASHQVVLLSTDTEIDEQAFRRIKKHVGRSYCLDYDYESASTSVRSGYFWE